MHIKYQFCDYATALQNTDRDFMIHDAFRRMLCEFRDTIWLIQASYEEMENWDSECLNSTSPRNHRQNSNAKVFLNGFAPNSKIVMIHIFFDIVEQGDFLIFNCRDKWRWDSVDFIPGFLSVEQCFLVFELFSENYNVYSLLNSHHVSTTCCVADFAESFTKTSGVYEIL